MSDQQQERALKKEGSLYANKQAAQNHYMSFNTQTAFTRDLLYYFMYPLLEEECPFLFSHTAASMQIQTDFLNLSTAARGHKCSLFDQAGWARAII